MCMDTNPHSGNSSVACAIGQIVNLLLTNFSFQNQFLKKISWIFNEKITQNQYLPHNRSKKDPITSIRSYVHIEGFSTIWKACPSSPEILSSFLIEFSMTIFCNIW